MPSKACCAFSVTSLYTPEEYAEPKEAAEPEISQPGINFAHTLFTGSFLVAKVIGTAGNMYPSILNPSSINCSADIFPVGEYKLVFPPIPLFWFILAISYGFQVPYWST